MSSESNQDQTQNFVPLAPDAEVGHYRITRKIGAGGMGEVFLAKDNKLDREVALKFLPPHLADDADLRARFIREAKAAARLNHPNIVTIYEVGEHNGRPFFAMEHVKGESLQQIAKDKQLPLDRVIDLVTQICAGLAEAHAAQIVHRDIKSSNIVVGEKGRPRILDFGLATVKGEDKLTRTGSTIGTVAYMAPEQIAGKETDARSDVFSLGVVCYELVTGRTPFRRDNNSATMSAIANDEPEPMARYKSGVSEELERIVAKALRKDIDARYQSVTDMLADLRNLSAPRKSPERANGRKMVAVLPFENLGSADDEYFADGVTEEITSRLAVVGGLGVISRTSALRYKGSKKSIAEIGQELGVDYILEGTVRWARGSKGSSRVRITPQLIHVSDDTHLWAERYDREIDDIFEVQSDIAEKVIEQLNITLLEKEQAALQAKPTDNVQAYDYFLKAKLHFNSVDYAKEEFEAAVKLFQKAIDVEPEFALAYAFLGSCHSSMYFHGHDRTEARIEEAQKAIDAALEIDPDLAEAHLAVGTLYYHHKRELDKALVQANKAASTIPHLANWLRMAVLRRKGLIADAMQVMKQIVESNPGDARVMLECGINYFCAQDYEKTREWLDKAIDANPTSLNARAFRMWLEIARGNVNAARDQIERIPEDVDTKSMLEVAFMYMFNKDFDRALTFLENYPDRWEISSLDYTPIDTFKSLVCHLMGDTEKCADYARRALEQLESVLEEHREDFRIHVGIGLTLALLGQFETAIEHGNKAMELCPTYQDALMGPINEERFVMILALSGRYEEAIDVIERIVGRRLWYTVPYFATHPAAEPLQTHPRMIELKEKFAYQFARAE